MKTILVLVALCVLGCGSVETMSVEEFSLLWADGWCQYEAACGIADPCPSDEWAAVAVEAYSCRESVSSAWAHECAEAIADQGCSIDVPPVCQLEVCDAETH